MYKTDTMRSLTYVCTTSTLCHRSTGISRLTRQIPMLATNEHTSTHRLLEISFVNALASGKLFAFTENKN